MKLTTVDLYNSITLICQQVNFSGVVSLKLQNIKPMVYCSGNANWQYSIPIQPNSVFNLGSIGKCITALLILKYFENQPKNLHYSVYKYFDKKYEPFFKNITLHQLLTHTSGLQDYMLHPMYPIMKAHLHSIPQFLPLILNETVSTLKKFHYSNSGYIILGAVLEKLTNCDYYDYVNTVLSKTFELPNTTLSSLNQIIPNKAEGYIFNNNKWYSNIFEVPVPSSDGGICSNVYDLQQLLSLITTHKFLKQSGFRLFTQAYANNNRYGYGIGIETIKNETVLFHRGNAAGLSAEFKHAVNNNFTLIVLSNTSNTANIVCKQIYNHLIIKNLLFSEE